MPAKTQYALLQVGYDIIGEYCDTPEEARQSAIDATRNDGHSPKMVHAPTYAESINRKVVGTFVVASREELAEHYGIGATRTIRIEFVGFTGARGSLEGYRADDFLPGYASQEFSSVDAANVWIVANYRGADTEGVNARFLAN